MCSTFKFCWTNDIASTPPQHSFTKALPLHWFMLCRKGRGGSWGPTGRANCWPQQRYFMYVCVFPYMFHVCSIYFPCIFHIFSICLLYNINTHLAFWRMKPTQPFSPLRAKWCFDRPRARNIRKPQLICTTRRFMSILLNVEDSFAAIDLLVFGQRVMLEKTQDLTRSCKLLTGMIHTHPWVGLWPGWIGCCSGYLSSSLQLDRLGSPTPPRLPREKLQLLRLWSKAKWAAPWHQNWSLLMFTGGNPACICIYNIYIL